MTVKNAVTHKRAMRKTLTPYLLLAPVIIFICCFMFWPIINVFILSMQNHVVTKPKNWGYTGFSHYVKIFTKDTVFTKSIFTTLRWVVVSVAFQCVLGFWLAYVLNKKFVESKNISQRIIVAKAAISVFFRASRFRETVYSLVIVSMVNLPSGKKHLITM